MTLAELRKSILVEGPPKRVAPGWDRDWRARLVENLRIMVRQLWQLGIEHTYRVELWPHFGQPAGIRDEHGNELEFPAAFRKSRLHQPRGIIQLLRTP